MIEVMKGQSLFDIVIQGTGYMESVFALAIENGLSITDHLDGISTISIPAGTEKDRDMVNYFTQRNLKPATDISRAGIEEGIEFWYIERDFVIS